MQCVACPTVALQKHLDVSFHCATADCQETACRVIAATGALELLVKTQMPPAARKLKATFCPSDDVTEPEYIAMGGENTGTPCAALLCLHWLSSTVYAKHVCAASYFCVHQVDVGLLLHTVHATS